jgi:hypothetical protein
MAMMMTTRISANMTAPKRGTKDRLMRRLQYSKNAATAPGGTALKLQNRLKNRRAGRPYRVHAPNSSLSAEPTRALAAPSTNVAPLHSVVRIMIVDAEIVM